MKQVFVVEGDNNELYSDHHNWFICVASSLEAAEEKIHSQFKIHHPQTERPIKLDRQVGIHYKWDWIKNENYEYDYSMDYDDFEWNDCITVYIHLENILGEE